MAAKKRKRTIKRSTRKTIKRSNPKSVYDNAGKLVGKFSRKSAKMIARVVGGTVGKPKVNPKRKLKLKPRKTTGLLLFRSKAAAVKYARANGAKRYSVKKLRRAR